MARKFPKLKYSEINTEVAKRTGQSNEIVWAIIRAYRDVIKEALCNGIEVPIPEIGTLTFQDYPPKPAGVYWDGFSKQKMYFPNRQGSYKLRVKATTSFRELLEKSTLYGEGASKQEWLEWVKKYRPGQELHGWLAKYEKEVNNDVEQDE